MHEIRFLKEQYEAANQSSEGDHNAGCKPFVTSKEERREAERTLSPPAWPLTQDALLGLLEPLLRLGRVLGWLEHDVRLGLGVDEVEQQPLPRLCFLVLRNSGGNRTETEERRTTHNVLRLTVASG